MDNNRILSRLFPVGSEKIVDVHQGMVTEGG